MNDATRNDTIDTHDEYCMCPDCANEPLSLDDMFGCDPWDDENIGIHPASSELV